MFEKDFQRTLHNDKRQPADKCSMQIVLNWVEENAPDDRRNGWHQQSTAKNSRCRQRIRQNWHLVWLILGWLLTGNTRYQLIENMWRWRFDNGHVSTSTHGNGKTKFNNGYFRTELCRFWMKRKIISSHEIIRPNIRPAGMAGSPIKSTNGSARSSTSRPFLWPSTCSTVTAPYVTAVQYNEPTITPAARNGLKRFIIVSMPSRMPTNVPISGNIIMYSVWHCGQLTRLNELPFCFSSTQRCRHDWCTHFVVPLHRHGCVHAASSSSSSVAKQTQQYRSSSALLLLRFWLLLLLLLSLFVSTVVAAPVIDVAAVVAFPFCVVINLVEDAGISSSHWVVRLLRVIGIALVAFESILNDAHAGAVAPCVCCESNSSFLASVCDIFGRTFSKTHPNVSRCKYEANWISRKQTCHSFSGKDSIAECFAFFAFTLMFGSIIVSVFCFRWRRKRSK